MKIKEKIESLISSKEEFDTLYNSDYIYIVKGNHPDDNNLIGIDVINVWDWKNKLRGPHDGPAKMANNENNHDWFHGYAWGVSTENIIDFEKSVMIETLKNGYVFEKISVLDQREEEKTVMFSNLFGE
jgi:hypothetical protein